MGKVKYKVLFVCKITYLKNFLSTPKQSPRRAFVVFQYAAAVVKIRSASYRPMGEGKF
jgi:hypothetical protein